jgi:hypothetical protein
MKLLTLVIGVRCVLVGTLALGMIASTTTTQAQSAAMTPNQILRGIKRFDALVSQGHVRYRRSIVSKKRTELFDSDVTYASDGRYVEKLTSFAPLRMSTKTVFDGTDCFSLTDNTLVIASGLPTGARPSLFWAIGVEPRPSLPMGRGLTGLKNLRIAVLGRWATVKGRLEDGTSLVAQVDTRDHFLVRKATRFDAKGKLVGTTITTGTLSNGLSAAKAVYKWDAVTETTSFSQAGFSAPNPAQFKFRINGKYTIVDERLGSPVNLSKNASYEISKAQVLQLSRSVLKRQTAKQMELDGAQKRQTAINTALLLSPGLLLASWFFLWRMKTIFTNKKHEKSSA